MLISVKPRKVKQLELVTGKRPFAQWFDRLKDVQVKAAIRLRIAKIELEGHFGNYRPLGDAVFELKFNQGPGYRIYFGLAGEEVVLLLLGGDKGSQERDVHKAKALWAEYLGGDL